MNHLPIGWFGLSDECFYGRMTSVHPQSPAIPCASKAMGRHLQLLVDGQPAFVHPPNGFPKLSSQVKTKLPSGNVVLNNPALIPQPPLAAPLSQTWQATGIPIPSPSSPFANSANDMTKQAPVKKVNDMLSKNDFIADSLKWSKKKWSKT